MDYPVILHVLSFSSEDLHRLVSKSLSEYSRGLKKPSSKLPISLLINGCEARAASGIASPVQALQIMVIWKCYNG